jgi:hypothetical protein
MTRTCIALVAMVAAGVVTAAALTASPDPQTAAEIELRFAASMAELEAVASHNADARIADVKAAQPSVRIAQVIAARR